jgi:YidC/Oxa1 family membrane protein insertase
VRVLLLPLTVRSFKQAQLRRVKLDVLQPQLEALKQKLAADPERLAKETLDLQMKAGVLPSLGTFATMLVQAPIGMGVYAAIQRGLGAGRRFLWVSDLARPDGWLVLALVALTVLSATTNPDLPPGGRLLAVMIPAALTAVTVWHLSSGLGLYMFASTAVAVAQSLVLRRRPVAR